MALSDNPLKVYDRITMKINNMMTPDEQTVKLVEDENKESF